MKTFTLTDRQARLLCWAMGKFTVINRPRTRGQKRLDAQAANVHDRICKQLREQSNDRSITDGQQ